MHDLPMRLIEEIASARAAITASYLRLWHGPDRASPTASGQSPRNHGEPSGDTPADAAPKDPP